MREDTGAAGPARPRGDPRPRPSDRRRARSASRPRPIAYRCVAPGMLRRLLPAALLIIVACAVALAVVLHGEDPATRGGATGDAAESALAQIGQGPAGSAVVTLDRWRYRADPDNRGRDRGWARGAWQGRSVRVPHSPNAGAHNGAAGRRAYAGAVGWYATDVDAPVGGRYAVRFESAHHRATVFVDGAGGARARRRLRAVHRARGARARAPHDRGARRLARPRGPGRQRLGAGVVQLRRAEPAGDAHAPGRQRARRAHRPHPPAGQRRRAPRPRRRRRARAQPRRLAHARRARRHLARRAHRRHAALRPGRGRRRHVARAVDVGDDRRARAVVAGDARALRPEHRRPRRGDAAAPDRPARDRLGRRRPAAQRRAAARCAAPRCRPTRAATATR